MVRQICGGPQRQLSDCGLVRVECAYGAKDIYDISEIDNICYLLCVYIYTHIYI